MKLFVFCLCVWAAWAHHCEWKGQVRQNGDTWVEGRHKYTCTTNDLGYEVKATACITMKGTEMTPSQHIVEDSLEYSCDPDGAGVRIKWKAV